MTLLNSLQKVFFVFVFKLRKETVNWSFRARCLLACVCALSGDDNSESLNAVFLLCFISSFSVSHIPVAAVALIP